MTVAKRLPQECIEEIANIPLPPNCRMIVNQLLEHISYLQGVNTNLASQVKPATEELFEFADITFDPHSFLLNGPRGGLFLAPKAGRILILLMRAKGKIVLNEKIKTIVWPEKNGKVTENVLHIRVHDLRSQIERSGSVLRVKTKHGLGIYLANSTALPCGEPELEIEKPEEIGF